MVALPPDWVCNWNRPVGGPLLHLVSHASLLGAQAGNSTLWRAASLSPGDSVFCGFNSRRLFHGVPMGHHRVGFKAADVSDMGIAGSSLQKRHDLKWTSFLAYAGQDSPATGGRCGATRRGYGEWVVEFRGRLRHTECAYYLVRGKVPRLQVLAAYAGLSGRKCFFWRHSELTRCGGQYPSASSIQVPAVFVIIMGRCLIFPVNSNSILDGITPRRRLLPSRILIPRASISKRDCNQAASLRTEYCGGHNRCRL